MKVFYPAYYRQFSCIAGRCPDSCCKEWSVDVDPESAAFYRGLDGTLGDRLRQVLQDTEDGTVMVIENGRCPMWRQDGLCRIHAELGHDALCKTCREFPRLWHDYGDFVELGLELSCPEAARLILTENPAFSVETAAGGESPEYDQEIMRTLLRTRKDFLDFLDTTALSVPQILAVLLLFAHEVQEELDGGMVAKLDSPACIADAQHFANSGDFRALADFFLGLEILTPQWKTRLESSAGELVWDVRQRALLRYFLCRYWLQAVSDYDLLCRVKFAIAACILVAGLGGDFIETAQLFSKEIENDPDNMEAILDGAYTSSTLTDVQLLGLLLGDIPH